MTRRPWLLGLDLVVALSAMYSGARLVVDPTGAAIGLSPSLLAHAPFRDYTVPGIALAAAVGGSAMVAAILLMVRARNAQRASAIAGAILCGWIVVEVAMIRTFHPMQPTLLAVGLAQVALGLWPEARRDVAVMAKAFFATGRVVFVGLSSQRDDFSRLVAKTMRDHGLEVVGVNPRATDGTYAHVVDVPSPPTAALLMVPPSQAEAALRDCLAAGVTQVWFHRGAGAGSASPEALALAAREGVTVITDVCPMMFLEPVRGVHRLHRFGCGHAAA